MKAQVAPKSGVLLGTVASSRGKNWATVRLKGEKKWEKKGEKKKMEVRAVTRFRNREATFQATSARTY